MLVNINIMRSKQIDIIILKKQVIINTLSGLSPDHSLPRRRRLHLLGK